jgi:hypothetical protein
MSGIIISKIDGKIIDRLTSFIDRLPAPERSRPIIFLDGKLYSWENVLEEFISGGEIANKLLLLLGEKSK